MLDLITLCVESGLNLNSAIARAVAKGPAGPLRDVRAGRALEPAAGEAARLGLAPGGWLAPSVLFPETVPTS